MQVALVVNMTEQQQMGWNDVIGNLKNATSATEEEKRTWAQRVADGEIGLPSSNPEYLKGTVEAAKAFLNGEETPFKGPKWVVDALEES
jgi:hypothetical protein